MDAAINPSAFVTERSDAMLRAGFQEAENALGNGFFAQRVLLGLGSVSKSSYVPQEYCSLFMEASEFMGKVSRGEKVFLSRLSESAVQSASAYNAALQAARAFYHPLPENLTKLFSDIGECFKLLAQNTLPNESQLSLGTLFFTCLVQAAFAQTSSSFKADQRRRESEWQRLVR